MALLQEHEKRVERIIVHEIPMTEFKSLKDWAAWPESENPKIVQICQGLFLDGMNEDKEAWLGLGEEYHKRLEKNFIVWVKNYSPCVAEMRWDRAELKRLKAKINWTLGGQMPMARFFLVMWCWQLRWGFQLRCWIVNCEYSGGVGGVCSRVL